jgi:fatty acid desaturase
MKVSDPVYTPPARPGPLDRLALRLLLDPRDLPFIHVMAIVAGVVYPFALYLYLTPDFSAWLGAGYLVPVMLVLFAPVILMHHCSSHRPIFRREHAWIRHWIPWGICSFFGLTPGTYYAHHIGMHHVEQNLAPDRSSTMRYRRDSFAHFLHYLGSFYVTGAPQLLAYLRDTRRRKLYRQVWVGELVYLLLAVGLLVLNWRATVVVLVIPYVLARVNLMMGNWTQHAFVDAADPGNPYLNSTTCINIPYNKMCFNDGYHIGHHVKPTRHWTEMPEDFEKNVDRYAREGAVVFDGIDYVTVFVLLMRKRYDRLAHHHARIGNLTQEELIARLRSRTRPIA